MSDKPKISAARGYEIDGAPQSVLTRYGEQAQHFNDQVQQSHMEISRESDPRDNITETSAGSDMVKASRAALESKPPPEFTKAQDRQSFDEQWAREASQAYDRHLADRSHDRSFDQDRSI